MNTITKTEFLKAIQNVVAYRKTNPLGAFVTEGIVGNFIKNIINSINSSDNNHYCWEVLECYIDNIVKQHCLLTEEQTLYLLLQQIWEIRNKKILTLNTLSF